MPQALLVNDKPVYKAECKNIDLAKLGPGQILVGSLFSGINYKDALAVTGKGKILKSFPLVPGIDVCGQVVQSQSGLFKAGDLVFQMGCDLGEKYNGGFSEQVILHDKYCLPIPENLSPRQIMCLGTAGFTAALAIYKMELNGLSKGRPVLVTGASGGVGSYAVQMLSQKGYSVTAMTGKGEAHQWLKHLGAQQIISPNELSFNGPPLGSEVWSGCIDNVGGEVLNALLSQTEIYGQVASIGLAGGFKVQSTVMPFILRGVNLLGVSSNNCPMALRKEIWRSISLKKPEFIEASQVVGLDQVISSCEQLLARQVTGRILVQF